MIDSEVPRAGIGAALALIGMGAILAASLGLFLRMPEASVDLTPWNHWRMPAITDPDAVSSGFIFDVLRFESVGCVCEYQPGDCFPGKGVPQKFGMGTNCKGEATRRDGA